MPHKLLNIDMEITHPILKYVLIYKPETLCVNLPSSSFDESCMLNISVCPW